MISALRDEERLDCPAHVLNNVLRNMFDEKKDCPLGNCTAECRQRSSEIFQENRPVQSTPQVTDTMLRNKVK